MQKKFYLQLCLFPLTNLTRSALRETEMYLWLWGKEKVLTDITCAKPSEQNQRVELLDDFNREKNRGLEISRPEMFWKSILIWRKELAIVIDLRKNIHFHATIDIILTRFRSGTTTT